MSTANIQGGEGRGQGRVSYKSEDSDSLRQEILTTQTLERASSSAFTRKPPRWSSTSRPDVAANSVLGSRPTATTRWSTDNCTQHRASTVSNSQGCGVGSPPESRFWPGVGVSLLKETPTPGPICFIWTCVILLQSI